MLISRVLFACMSVLLLSVAGDFTDADITEYREKVKRMFYHAYNGYLDYAFPYDELKPITCKGADTWGSFSLTLIDALDTLVVMGNHSEFKRAVKLVLENVDPEANVNVSVFETNIRVVGGLLTAHMLSGQVEDMELEEGWPCSGPLLRLAERMAQKLLPAFDTDTGMPYGTVNLRYGVHKSETPITCTAGVGTFVVEFGTLSRLTGDPQYERVAMRALDALWNNRSPIGLVGNHIDVQTGVWTATDSGIGAGVDSYFEYLVKGAYLLNRPDLMHQFNEFETVINKRVRREDWFHWVTMQSGTTSLPIFQSLEAFWPGVLTMIGKVEDASRIMQQYAELIRKYGFPPEFYHLKDQQPVNGRAAFPLRPEMTESLMYLYRATDDPMWLELGAEMVDAIDSAAKTRCGYATVQKVHFHGIEDRMESFFLAETTKYLYLLFDPQNFLHNDGTRSTVIDTPNGKCVIAAGGYIYNTEAHPIDPAIVHCCSAAKQAEREAFTRFHENIDFVSLLHLRDTSIASRSRGKMRAENEDDSESVEVKEPNPSDSLEHKKQADGSQDIEFEVDPSLVAKSDLSAEENVAKDSASEESINVPLPLSENFLRLPEVKRMIKQLLKNARLLDDENVKKRMRRHVEDTIREALKDLANELPVLARSLDVSLPPAEALRQLLLRRVAAGRVPVVVAECEGCCRALDYVGDSVTLRRMLSVISEKQIYPALGISFMRGPICRSSEKPSEKDMYKITFPDLVLEDGADDEDDQTPAVVSFTTPTPPPKSSESYKQDYRLLTAPVPGFMSKFSGGGFVNPRVL